MDSDSSMKNITIMLSDWLSKNDFKLEAEIVIHAANEIMADAMRRSIEREFEPIYTPPRAKYTSWDMVMICGVRVRVSVRHPQSATGDETMNTKLKPPKESDDMVEFYIQNMRGLIDTYIDKLHTVIKDKQRQLDEANHIICNMQKLVELTAKPPG